MTPLRLQTEKRTSRSIRGTPHVCKLGAPWAGVEVFILYRDSPPDEMTRQRHAAGFDGGIAVRDA